MGEELSEYFEITFFPLYLDWADHKNAIFFDEEKGWRNIFQVDWLSTVFFNDILIL